MPSKDRNYRQANLALGLLAVGFLVSYPFGTTFFGGLLNSAFRAGLIGGLADWFAVTAFFRRPLGIPPSRYIRTEIIPRNRDRIFQALADTVQNELITKQALEDLLNRVSFAHLLRDYIITEDGQTHLNQLLTDILTGIAADETPLFTGFTGKITSTVVSEAELAPLLAAALQQVATNHETERLAAFCCQTCADWTTKPEIVEFLALSIQRALLAYTDKNPARKILLAVLPAPAEIAKVLLAKLRDHLTATTTSAGLVDWIHCFAGRLEKDPLLQAELAGLQRELAGSLASFLDTNPPRLDRETIQNSGISLAAHRVILQLLGEKWGNTIDLAISQWAAGQHQEIGIVVRKGLDRLSGQDLAELIETRAGNDLQMVRINGSLVGFLVGAAIFLLSSL